MWCLWWGCHPSSTERRYDRRTAAPPATRPARAPPAARQRPDSIVGRGPSPSPSTPPTTVPPSIADPADHPQARRHPPQRVIRDRRLHQAPLVDLVDRRRPVRHLLPAHQQDHQTNGPPASGTAAADADVTNSVTISVGPRPSQRSTRSASIAPTNEQTPPTANSSAEHDRLQLQVARQEDQQHRDPHVDEEAQRAHAHRPAHAAPDRAAPAASPRASQSRSSARWLADVVGGSGVRIAPRQNAEIDERDGVRYHCQWGRQPPGPASRPARTTPPPPRRRSLRACCSPRPGRRARSGWADRRGTPPRTAPSASPPPTPRAADAPG